MAVKKFTTISTIVFLLALPIILFFFYDVKPKITNLGSGAIPKDLDSLGQLREILPVTNKNFSIIWRPEKNKIQITLFEPRDESLNAVNTWFAENNFTRIPWESVKLIDK